MTASPRYFQLPPQPTRIIRNRYKSGTMACAAWLAGGLWGNPIRLGPDKFHVYGLWRRKWRPVSVEFTAETIVVMNPLGLICGGQP